MRRLFIIIIVIVVFGSNIYSQTDSSIYSNTRYVPRFSIGYQGYGYFELGICRQYCGYNKNGGGCSDFYLTNEFILNNSNVIWGPKIGYELMIAGNIAILLGFDAVQYFDRSHQNFVMTPRIFLPLTKNCTPLIFFSYGYNIYTTEYFHDLIGKHKFSLIFNMNFKDHKNVNRIYNSNLGHDSK